MGIIDKADPKKSRVAAITGAAAALLTAAVAAYDFLPSGLSEKLSEKIASGGLTVNSLVTAIAIWVIAMQWRTIKTLREKLDLLMVDADKPPPGSVSAAQILDDYGDPQEEI